jgi:cytochrome c-type biogenesis protein CcmF
MPAIDVPFFGNLLLCATLVAASYTFAMALGAGRGRPHLLLSARWGTYATCALVAGAVFLLAFAFQTHDFRIRYVASYSDRSMEWWYLITSLWGGQDGSLLWWSFLLCGWTGVCVRWMRGRFLELQPWVIATLMSILLFFTLLMLFAANPFATYAAGAPAKGEGLNPLLQNYWMTIHPPSLYMGFVGWSVPFAFVVAALVTGRLNDEWIHATRRWTLTVWLFLSIGLLLGALWSYEELGWGGYWAWDPVENASFMPWLVGTAYLHSIIIQERYGMMKVWNVFLLCLTFIMTIFGTFLTRSGLISSVHSFARSDIGIWFVYYLVILIAACAVLIVVRLPKLKAEHQIQSLMSREFAFLLNNWALLGMMVFVLVATTFPLLSEWLRGQEVTVGPGFYNKWMVPFGLALLFMAGVGPLIAWRKATGKNLARAFVRPAIAAVVVACLHIGLGSMVGFSPVVEGEEIYDTLTGKVLAALYSIAPVVSTSLSAFVLGTVVQEFWRGTAVRMRKGESAPTAFFRLVSRARRRYGGYIVHVGIVLMYIGFTGAAYDQEKEAALRPGESMEVGGYEIRYDDARMESDRKKRMLYTDMTLMDEGGEVLDEVAPAKFIYRTHPEMPTTEVAIRSRPLEDVYVIMSTVDPQTERGTFRVIVRPLVWWIWAGGLVLILGALVAIWPSVREIMQAEERRNRRSRGDKRARGASAAAAVLLALLMLGAWPSGAQAQGTQSSSLHAGTVVIHNSDERKLFERLLCMCGDCARLPLDTCGCSWAQNARAELRNRLSAGDALDLIIKDYRDEHGSSALAIPMDEGLDRALWAVPVSAVVVAGGGVFWIGRRWKRRGAQANEDEARRAEQAKEASGPARRSEQDYDAQIDEELERMEGEP